MNTNTLVEEKILAKKPNGLAVLVSNTILLLLCIGVMVWAFIALTPSPLMVFLLIITMLYAFIIGPIIYIGLKVIKPNEASAATWGPSRARASTGSTPSPQRSSPSPPPISPPHPERWS